MNDSLWGIGCYDDGDRRVAWEISHTEMQRDIDAATRILTTLGIGAGRRVLFCSMLSEAGQFWPLTVGAMLTSAQLSCADANEGDATRVAMFTRLVEYHAVLGITGAVLDGLDALDQPYAEVFGGVAVLGARPDAHERLQRAGLVPSHFVLCGPAVAVAATPGAPARVDPDEWRLEVDSDDGRVLVTSLQPRATGFTQTPTAVHGTLDDGGLVPRSQ
jgi:hypothetical protein